MGELRYSIIYIDIYSTFFKYFLSGFGLTFFNKRIIFFYLQYSAGKKLTEKSHAGFELVAADAGAGAAGLFFTAAGSSRYFI